MIKTIGNFKVDIKEKITYGEKEDIALVVDSDSVDRETIKEFRSKLLATYIVSIKEGEKEVPLSEEWLRSLDADDGTELVEYISGIFNQKKNQ